MHRDCEAALAAYLGRDLRAAEARDAEDLVKLHMRLAARADPKAWMALSNQERLAKGAEGAAQAIVEDLRLKQRRVNLQIAAVDRIEADLQTRFAALPPKAKAGARLKALSGILAFDPAQRAGALSVHSAGQAIANGTLGELTPLWSAVKGFAHLFENAQGVRDLVHELFGESSGNGAAAAGANVWKDVIEKLRQRAIAAGMDIGKLEDWRYPQSWSSSRVATAANGDAAASLAKWQADLLPLLDRDRYLNADGSRMSDDQLRHMLAQVFDSITTDGQNKRTPGMPQVGGSIANRHTAHRALFFKDSESYLTAQGLYGQGSLWNALTSHVRSLSRDIALAETLGPNAAQTFRLFNDRTLLEELRANPRQASSIRKQATQNESLYDYVSGRHQAVNDNVAAAFQAWRNWQTASKLGQVVLTALGDEAGMSATAFANRIPYLQVLAQQLKPGEWRAASSHSGLGINSMIGGLNRYGYEDLQMDGGDGTAGKVRNFTSKLATGVLNVSGAEFMWDNRRKALGALLQSYLGKWTREVANAKDLNVQDHGMIARKGVTETDWQVWKRAELEDWGTPHGVLTQKGVMAIPDERLADLAQYGTPEELRRHAATLLLGHVLEETGMGVMDTGPRERSRMLFGTQAGTVEGELARSAFLFKSFAFSMMMKHWARAASLPGGTQAAAYAARLAVAGTVFGGLALQLHHLASGQDPANMAEPQFWAEAALRGGGLGFYGDFLYSELGSHDNTFIPSVLGPMATEAEQVWGLTGAAAFKAARGERTDEGAKVMRFLRGDLPFLNMWYTKAAVDHLLWNEFQETASPGYLERLQARAYADRGTTWWWNPSERQPARGPDIQQAFRPDIGRRQLARLQARIEAATE